MGTGNAKKVILTWAAINNEVMTNYDCPWSDRKCGSWCLAFSSDLTEKINSKSKGTVKVECFPRTLTLDVSEVVEVPELKR